MGTTSINRKIGQGLTGLLGTSLLLAMASLGGGCQNKLYDENAALREQSRELQARLDERAQIQQAAQPVVAAPAPEAPRPAILAAPAPAPAPIAPLPPAPIDTGAAVSASGDLSGLDTQENKTTGTMTVKFLGDELFDPGAVTLKDSSKKDLNKVASALKKQYAGRTVRIEGHTDADPIKHSKWASNMELSKARADTVRQYLAGKGVNAALIFTQGFGDTKLKTPDPAQKAQNRRVEIVVLAR